MKKKNNPGCPCCGEECEAWFFDNFDRASIGSDWSVNSGTWNITSNQLSTTSTNAAIIANTAAGKNKYVVTVTCGGSTNQNDVLKVIVNWADANNHHFVEITFGATQNTIKIWRRSGGFNTQLGTTTNAGAGAGNPFTISVCVKPGLIAWTSGGSFDMDTTTTTSLTAGLGTGGTLTGTATFDDFSIDGHRDDNEVCGNCPSLCEGCQLEKALETVTVTISGLQNNHCNCSSGNGSYPFSANNFNLNCATDGSHSHNVTCDFLQIKTCIAYDSGSNTSSISVALGVGGCTGDCTTLSCDWIAFLSTTFSGKIDCNGTYSLNLDSVFDTGLCAGFFATCCSGSPSVSVSFST